MRHLCDVYSTRSSPAGGSLGGCVPTETIFKGLGCVRRFSPFMDLPVYARPQLIGVFIDEEEAAEAAFAAASPVSSAAATAAALARAVIGRILQHWGPRGWGDPRSRRKSMLPGSGGIVVCSSRLLLRCSVLTGVCSSIKPLPAAACCCCFASKTSKGPLLVVGCVDGTLRVYSGKTLQLLVTLDSMAAAVSTATGGGAVAGASRQRTLHSGYSARSVAEKREVESREATRPALGKAPAGTPQEGVEIELQQTPTCVLLVGNNAVLAGLGGGLTVAFFLENCRRAAVYQPPASILNFLQEQEQQKQHQFSLHSADVAALQQLQLDYCRELAARKWRGETEMPQLQRSRDSDSSSGISCLLHECQTQLPVCCLYAAAAERLVVVAVHPEAWTNTQLLDRNNHSRNSRNSSALQRRWRSSAQAAYLRAPPPVVAAAAENWSSCCIDNSVAGGLAGVRGTGGTASVPTAAKTSDAAPSFPLLVYQQQTGTCVGALWGASSRTLAVALGNLPVQSKKLQRQQEYMCCLAVTTTHVLFWQQQWCPCSGRKLQQRPYPQRPSSALPQQHQNNGVSSLSSSGADGARMTAMAAAVEQLKQQQRLHEKRRGDATVCPSFLCGSKTSMCQLATAAAAVSELVAATRQTESPEHASAVGLQTSAGESLQAAEGGCVGDMWLSLSSIFCLPDILMEPLQKQQQQQQQQHQQDYAYTLADAVVDWGSRLIVLLPSSSSRCCLLSWSLEEDGFMLLPLRWVQVITRNALASPPFVIPNFSALLAAAFAEYFLMLICVQVAATDRSLQKPILHRLWYSRGLLATSAADGFVRFLFRPDLSTQQREETTVQDHS
ncbi:hypothetical protein, conserved [Eimeria necatrix]|uniref:Uncharacterized protein n=1 Tax=Eimeria necatrix TaxID=51315 RepID=U6MQY3_9EIME|nr:hypothetical protein, conserved [Eimeria necatrix]CDJ64030.1 hypothetical protein, conserved [Eimeria necatrix]